MSSLILMYRISMTLFLVFNQNNSSVLEVSTNPPFKSSLTLWNVLMTTTFHICSAFKIFFSSFERQRGK